MEVQQQQQQKENLGIGRNLVRLHEPLDSGNCSDYYLHLYCFY